MRGPLNLRTSGGEGGESGGKGEIAQEEGREGLNKGRRQGYSPKLLIG